MPHVGKRGRVLLFFGALDLIYAVSLASPDETTRHAPMFVWLAEVAPLWAWSVMWAGVGVACLVHAFFRRDQVGYAAAIGLKIGWGLLSLGGWLFGGVDRGYVSAVIWLGLAWMVWVISGWPELDGRERISTRQLS